MPGFIKSAFDSVGEAVGQPLMGAANQVVNEIVDQGSQMVEAGMTSVVGSASPADPQNDAKRQAEEAKRHARDQQRINNILSFLKQLEADDKARLARQNQQKEQEKAVVKQEEVQKKQFEVAETQQKQQSLAVRQQQTRSEVKGGLGG